MTIEQKIPQAVPVAQGQVSNGVTAINNRDNRVESAAFGFVNIAVDSVTETLTSAQFWEGLYFILSGGSPTPGGAVTLTVPAEERGVFAVYNGTGQTVTVTISGQAIAAPTVADGESELFISDGVNVRLAKSSGASGNTYYDVPCNFAGGPPTTVQIIGATVVAREILFAANFAGSYGYIGTNPTGSFVISVKDDGTEIGTITISTGGGFTFATSSGTSKTVAAGSRLEFVAPASVDATAAYILATLAGTA